MKKKRKRIISDFCKILDTFTDQQLLSDQLKELVTEQQPFDPVTGVKNDLLTINFDAPFFGRFPELRFSLHSLALAFAYSHNCNTNGTTEEDHCSTSDQKSGDIRKTIVWNDTTVNYERRTLDFLSIVFNGFNDFSLFTAIAGECYEKGRCSGNSMILFPCGMKKRSCGKIHFFEEDEWIEFNEKNIHAIRKLLVCTDSKTKLLIETVPEDSQTVLRVIGISYNECFSAISPEILFKSATEWVLLLPFPKLPHRAASQKKKAFVRYCNGRFLLPTLDVGQLLEYPLKEVLFSKDADEIERIIKTIAGIWEERRAGMIMIFLPPEVAVKESIRLSCMSRGYHLIGPTKGSYSATLAKLTKIDGAIIFNLGTADCFAFGAILSATMGKGVRSRGSRLLSTLDYIRYINEEYPNSNNHFAVVISDDGMVDLITKQTIIDEFGVLHYSEKRR